MLLMMIICSPCWSLPSPQQQRKKSSESSSHRLFVPRLPEALQSPSLLSLRVSGEHDSQE
jgi:hypothetical protein